MKVASAVSDWMSFWGINDHIIHYASARLKFEVKNHHFWIERYSMKKVRIILVLTSFVLFLPHLVFASTATYDNALIGHDYSGDTPPTNGMIVEGAVGIGTSTPARPLDIYSGSGDNAINLTAASGGAFLLINSSNNYASVLGTHSGTVIWAAGQMGNSSDYRIMVGGDNSTTNAIATFTTTNVGIGTTLPSGTLQTYAASGDNNTNITSAAGGSFVNIIGSNNYDAIIGQYSGAIKWATGQTGNSGDYRIMVGGANSGTNAILTATTGGIDIGTGYAGAGYTPPINGMSVQGVVTIGTTTPASSYVGFDVQAPIIRFGDSSYPANYPTGGLCSSCTYLVLDKIGTSNDASVVYRDSGNARAEIGIVGDDNIHFKTVAGTYGSESFSDRMTILGAGSANPGNIGIATTNPASLLSVGTNSEFQVAYLGKAWSQGLLHIGTSSVAGAVAQFENSTAVCNYGPNSGGTFTCSSDTKFKTDIKDTGSALPWINSMRIRDFTIKATGERATGVIAQELQQTYPDMVHKNPQGFLPTNRTDTYLMVDQPNPWMLVKAIQEIKAENDGLRRDFETYKAAHP